MEGPNSDCTTRGGRNGGSQRAPPDALSRPRLTRQVEPVRLDKASTRSSQNMAPRSTVQCWMSEDREHSSVAWHGWGTLRFLRSPDGFSDPGAEIAHCCPVWLFGVGLPRRCHAPVHAGAALFSTGPEIGYERSVFLEAGRAAATSAWNEYILRSGDVEWHQAPVVAISW